ncbi:hypothetical protein PR048_030936 [Dryococelus australis]|uniref:FZ domain-containing protein n=1 Tax=Dryococelus australis TaxID=614101 RepID=A0ABQ9GAE3_9NEOP|nr:hypothetical protein PR048_030936 [Dryococelus australis]
MRTERRVLNRSELMYMLQSLNFLGVDESSCSHCTTYCVFPHTSINHSRMGEADTSNMVVPTPSSSLLYTILLVFLDCQLLTDLCLPPCPQYCLADLTRCCQNHVPQQRHGHFTSIKSCATIQDVCCRIVRNKAAEKAKHVHHQQQQQQQQQQVAGAGAAGPGAGAAPSSVSVIAHAPAAPHHADPHRAASAGGYSINGILGIPQPPDPAASVAKRKRDDQHAESRWPKNALGSGHLSEKRASDDLQSSNDRELAGRQQPLSPICLITVVQSCHSPGPKS